MNTQAITQATKAFNGPGRSDAIASAPDAEWTVDDVVRTIRNTDQGSHHARRWLAALGALTIAAAATATVSVSADRAGASPKPLALPSRIAAALASRPATAAAGATPAHAPLPSRVAAATGHGPVSRSQSLIVVMPADRDYLSATSIPVAGIALGRPHGPRIRSVHVALYVDGRLLEGTDLEVYSGRFAGVLGLAQPIERAAAELRFSDPDNPRQAAVVRPITLDAPTTTR